MMMTWGEFFTFSSFIVALVALIVNLCKERNGTKKK